MEALSVWRSQSSGHRSLLGSTNAISRASSSWASLFVLLAPLFTTRIRPQKRSRDGRAAKGEACPPLPAARRRLRVKRITRRAPQAQSLLRRQDCRQSQTKAPQLHRTMQQMGWMRRPLTRRWQRPSQRSRQRMQTHPLRTRRPQSLQRVRTRRPPGPPQMLVVFASCCVRSAAKLAEPAVEVDDSMGMVQSLRVSYPVPGAMRKGGWRASEIFVVVGCPLLCLLT